ncbi:hypothetical protein VMCG_00971 [Cytospora schulzeri]|uniref:Pre-mRNA-processing protein prp40 n=1 Tax=Cytospora schulzeri TaxID=448051 RepID=A0A423X5C4_9PEZI|nr:hypothetical protein VMCG_00971 [Valsa malicola]
MNGINGQIPLPGAVIWQEHRTADGRTYYYNTATKVTQWTKPEDIMSPAERALANQPWKEYTAEGGRKYWYNTDTKTSSWEMPDAYKRALGTTSTGTPTTPATPSAFPTPGGMGGFDQSRDQSRDYRDHRDHRDQRDQRDHRDQRDYRDQRDQREPLGESRQLTFGNDLRAQQFVPASDEPDYATREEAEAAYVKLLKRSGVQPDWTWEQALRAIVKDPQYRAIKDPRDRKAAFEKYCQDVVAQDKERAKERLAKLRSDFGTMLKSHPEIKHYTRWKTARQIIEGETIFRSTNDDNERRQLFEDYIIELKKRHREEQAALRKSAMDGLIDLLPKLNLEPYTRWSEAQETISATQPFQDDEKYKTLSKFDILTVFQNHMKAVERTFNDTRQAQKAKKQRKERRARDAFLSLLGELKKDGKIKVGTKWSQIFPLVESDIRYTAMLGQNGSTPQELFWDIVEEEERGLRGTRNDVTDVVYDKRFEVTPKTDFQDFLAIMKEDRRTANIDRDTLKFIFERLQEKKAKPSDEDRHAERQQRRAIDDLRSYMKRLDPPITLSDTYEKVKSRLQKTPEFQTVTSDEGRRSAFDKHMRRLREKEEELEKDRRRRDRSRDRFRERERERSRDRGERSHRSGRTPRRSSRSPEPDLYEADRRKAIAERERNYRKTSMAETLLSDRSHYERERRDREEERERSYRRRVVERDVDDLNYGDEKPAVPTRRRRADDEDERRPESRDSKIEERYFTTS